jgi:SPP1 gp7 family putative phage head morphogenesis protein
MSISKDAIRQAITLLGKSEAKELYRLAKKQEALEAKWRRKLKVFFDELNEHVAMTLITTDKVEVGKRFEEFFAAHMFEAIQSGMRSVRSPTRVPAKLAKIPFSLKGLQDAWDKWRKKGELPHDLAPYVKKVKQAYIKKAQDVWRRESKDFREGGVYNQKAVVKSIYDSTKGSYARSKMIVETETTRYYNQSRREYYDASDVVTHYMFMAIRDHRTTKWCKTRHGLVYAKGDELTDKETPPIHYNCRSELVPLTPYNPNHEKIIKDKRLNRRTTSRTVAPMLPGWNE